MASEIQPESVIGLQVDTAVHDPAEYSVSDLPDGFAPKISLTVIGKLPGHCRPQTTVRCPTFHGTR